MNTLREKELLRRIAEGDEVAFREVFNLYKDRFYAAALKMTRSSDLSEEIVQEVFVNLWLHRSGLAEVENPSSYLFSIVYHSISSHFKKIALEERMKEKISQKMTEGYRFTEEMIEEKESRLLLQNVIQQLPSQQQLIYKLSKQDGLSWNEIAEQVHISPNTVKDHLLKAIKYIREHFKEALLVSVWFFI